MPHTQAQTPGPSDLGYHFQMAVRSETGVVVVAPAAHLAAHGIPYAPGPGVREIRVAPGRYRVRWEHGYAAYASDRFDRIEVGADGLVLVGCPARLASGAGADTYNAWLLATDFLRRDPGCVVVDPAPAAPDRRLHLALYHDLD